jgi:cell division protease FtsH
MSGFPWFPLGYRIPGCAIGPLRREDFGYQIIATQGADKVVLVVESESLAGKAAQKLPNSSLDGFSSFEFGGKSYFSRVFDKDQQPVVIAEWSKMTGLPTSSDIAGLSKAIRSLRQLFPRADISRALYLSSLAECLPVIETNKPQDLRALAAEVLVAGAPVDTLDAMSIRAVNSWLLSEEIEAFLAALGVGGGPEPEAALAPETFSLPGRPKLEKFFREYVLEPSADRERYAALGVKRPNGILLYGPPGSGKSHAVGKLKAALGWPIFEINLGEMGSMFIHQTSVNLRTIFNEAKRKAPSIIVLEEVDALAGSRAGAHAGQSYKVEEVTELLRLVESASDNNILVIATTNRRDSLDAAILRKGRFDHAIEVGYPSREEARAAVEAMLRDRPHRETPNLGRLAEKLANRPMSDIGWVIDEAARLAARGKKDAIDEIDLFSALEALGGH